MLGRLLTPLRARFEPPTQPESNVNSVKDEDASAEDFARDVLVELMRNAVEKFKEADALKDKIEVMGEMHRIMVENACTKDVFRELDGYLLVVNVLSILHAYFERDERAQKASETTLTEDGERLAFMLIAESFNGRPAIERYFERRIGYGVLRQALSPLLLDRRTVDQTFGFMLSVALNNFALSSIFVWLRNSEKVDISDYKPLLGVVRHAGALKLVVDSLSDVARVQDDSHIARTTYIILEHLAGTCHRNKALLSSISVFSTLFKRLLAVNENDPTRPLIMKLLKRLVDIPIPFTDARLLFESSVKDGKRLNTDVLEIIRAGMKSRWPQHYTLEGPASIRAVEDNVKGLPSSGFTFMIWLWVETFPTASRYTLFKISRNNKDFLHLMVRLDGILELLSSGNSELGVLANAKISKGRWTHVTLVHHPHRVSSPTIRIFIDGVLVESRNWQYPKSDSFPSAIRYTIGDQSVSTKPWCIASAYLLSRPLPDDLPRLIHHLGPRYHSHFQAQDIIRFLTYEGATALNVYLSNLVTSPARGSQVARSIGGLSPLMRAIKDGVIVPEDAFVFSLSPFGYTLEEEVDGYPEVGMFVRNGVSHRVAAQSKMEIEGDVVAVSEQSLDIAMWKLGGSSIALKLIELANTSHELSRTLSIFTDSARSSWQMSEDMESIHAYDILSHILRRKAHLINITAFETVFELLGFNFRSPDNSVVTNSLAYRSIALDFEIWSGVRPDIQSLHLAHFATLLKSSKYRVFNAKQRLGKFGVIRKLLFVLQADWYPREATADIVSAVKTVAQACFNPDQSIKPLVSYLAANLHEVSSDSQLPHSKLSTVNRPASREKAEAVLEAFVSLLHSPSLLSKFTAALPLHRTCLLLLGDKPTPTIACQILTLLGLAIRASPSFARKFELVSGWKILQATLPSIWNPDVQKSVFDVLFGRISTNDKRSKDAVETSKNVTCSYILSTILFALGHGLSLVVQDKFDEEGANAHAFAETLMEELMELQATSVSFRQLFKAQQSTETFVKVYSTFVSNGVYSQQDKARFIRLLEKLNHFALALTLDTAVSSSQKQEILLVFHQAEAVLNVQYDNFEPPQSGAQEGASGGSAFKLQNTSRPPQEGAFLRTTTMIHRWRDSIASNERKRYARTILDLRESRRHADDNNEWRTSMRDRGLWPLENSIRGWALDETEGPCRIRKKLARRFESSIAMSISQELSRAVSEPDDDAQSFVQVEAPPWAENYDLHDTDSDRQWLDELTEDKHRRVRHELRPGDVIDAVCTVSRIVGVDSSPGLLILGRTNLYMLDGLVEDKGGEVIEARDAPRDLFSVPGSMLELDGKQRAQCWLYEQLATFSMKTCLFRDVALELYFRDSRSLLVVFPTKKDRQRICEKLQSSVTARSISESRSPLILRTPLLAKVSSKVFSGGKDELSTAQRKWQAREISNFSYLSIINQSSGRTPGDATQYPIFPWVLADYTSESLDLMSPSTFRDLTRPMGALTEDRSITALQTYSNLLSVGERPFHYGTHFSSSMIVCHFLIRIEPFTHMFKTLQGGDWDLPDRLFSDVARAYHSASEDQRGDVRELIPEFYTCPEFLKNFARLDFGTEQTSGEKINNVKLPPWAKDDAVLFIEEHRRALESDFVSENLPAWIDLIWGYKQNDVNSLNVFHPLSYEGAIDLDALKDDHEREATVGIIHNFGQTPRKVFDLPHPPKIMQGRTSLPLGTQYGVEEDPHLLVQSSRAVSELQEPVVALPIDMVFERVLPCPKEVMYIPNHPHEYLAWGSVDGSLKLNVDRKVVQVTDHVSCLCVAFVDSECFVTGSSDCMLRLWKLNRGDGSPRMTQTNLLRAHTNKVISVTACRSWSIIVSGSSDGSLAIWDLNRAIYVRSIFHESFGQDCEVHAVAINESTGYIASCSNKKLCLHTINALPIAELDLFSVSPITSLSFLEREYVRYGILATGHENGTIALRTWSAKDTPSGKVADWKFVTKRLLRCREGSDGRFSRVTALQFVGEGLFHAEESGKVFVWDLPD